MVKKARKKQFIMRKFIIAPQEMVVGIIVKNLDTEHFKVLYYLEKEREEITNLITKKDL